jgi:hypothetical protein
MKTLAFRMWESNHTLLNALQLDLEKKRGQVLSQNLILNEALKMLCVKEGVKND